ncbi:unnamed protein product [Arctogadus glacialis]
MNTFLPTYDRILLRRNPSRYCFKDFLSFAGPAAKPLDPPSKHVKADRPAWPLPQPRPHRASVPATGPSQVSPFRGPPLHSAPMEGWARPSEQQQMVSPG